MNTIEFEEKEMQCKKAATEEYFDEIAENYDKSHDGRFVRCMYDEIVARVLQKKATDILDLGCGNGNVLKILTERTDANLYGLDLSEKMIQQAKIRLKGNVKLQIGDAEKLPYENQQFDVIICNASFHHYIYPELVLTEIRRVLKPQGKLIIGDPTAPFTWCLKLLNWGLKRADTGDYYIYGRKEITQILEKNGFEVSQFKRISNRTFILDAVMLRKNRA